ncbi:MAG: phytoene/squalene synthase family protein [Hyphomicrobiaceae bacterium]|nr:phytoene/squalene synthase family protein [Hyphomicrobiaceae bacterium]
MEQIIAFSRDRIEKGSKSFAGASRLFDPTTRASAYMLYAWCRHCDDEIDGQELGFNTAEASTPASAERLSNLRERTIAAIEGRASEPIFLALQTVVERHAIPARHPLELIEGMAMDVRGHSYHTLDDTLLYSYHVAGVVGVMMAMVMGARDPATLDRASDLGIAFQLTNIARDVHADASVGRVYLPAEWLTGAGVEPSPDAVAAPENREAIHGVTLQLLGEADRYYESAGEGLQHLPLRSAMAIAAARRVYSDIGNVVRERGASAGASRASLSRMRKLTGLVTATGDAVGAHTVGRWRASKARDGLWTMPRDTAAGSD